MFLKSVPIALKLILTPFVDPRKIRKKKKKIQKMTIGKNVEMARILGFQEVKIRHALKQGFEKDDENFPTFHDLMDALIEAADFFKSKINLEQAKRF